jgi:phosphatidylinositol alpha-1,6-mannosyltransferase
MLSPSRGLGGGIERYAETLEWAFRSEQVPVTRLDLNGPLMRHKAIAHYQLYAACRSELQDKRNTTHIVVLHRSLLPVAWLLARNRPIRKISVVCHGNEVWGNRPFCRSWIEKRILEHSTVRIIAVSSYTAGALSRVRAAGILPPGLSAEWFNTLVQASTVKRQVREQVELITAFRLGQWRDKGLSQLIEAVAALGRRDIHLNICGIGSPPPDLLHLLHAHSWCTLFTDLPPSQLAQKFAEADLMVLATQARPGRDAFYESYGLVLIEAQVAGTPVIAPAFGGSRDTFVAQRTGVCPSGQAPEDLSLLLAELTRDRERLALMGAEASKWARDAFSPETYARRAIASLL